MSVFRKTVPWWVRIGAKIILAQLPVSYSFWKRLRLFEHGDMNQPECALDTFIEHARTAGFLATELPVPRLKATGDFSMLELGPGDSLFSAVIAGALGVSRSWLVDVGPFATTDMDDYMRLFDLMRQKGYSVPFKDYVPSTIAEVLRVYNGEYLTEGVQSLARVPSAAVDFCFSNAVLEHITKGVFARLADELIRVLKPDGVCVHRVDLKDHLGGGLNNLRFSEAIWEGSLFSNSGFYTNRIRFGEMVALFEKTGFECYLPRVVRWEVLPIHYSKLDASFRDMPLDDLMISGFDIVLKHKG